MGAAAEGSQEREGSAQDDAPMSNPYEQPSRRGRSQEREEPQGRGCSQEREEPQDVWEQQRSSSGSPESPQYDDPQQDAQDNQQRSHQWTSRTTQWERKQLTSGKQKIHQMI